MKTYAVKAGDIERAWHVLDATGQPLGRLASRIAQLLRGKHKPIYSPHLDTGDYVIVINAAQVKVGGRKSEQKLYYRHSGYPGGFRQVTLGTVLAKWPTRAIEHAVKGMLPHGPLGKDMRRKLKVYPGPDHPHQAQIKVVSPPNQAQEA